MRKSTAVIASAGWFAIAGGVGAVLVPWWLTGWRFRHPLPYWGIVEVLGSVIVFVGEALLFGQLSVLIYALAAWAATAIFVRWYEEPALVRRFGPDYAAYRRAVPAWRPRLLPWYPGESVRRP